MVRDRRWSPRDMRWSRAIRRSRRPRGMEWISAPPTPRGPAPPIRRVVLIAPDSIQHQRDGRWMSARRQESNRYLKFAARSRPVEDPNSRRVVAQDALRRIEHEDVDELMGRWSSASSVSSVSVRVVAPITRYPAPSRLRLGCARTSPEVGQPARVRLPLPRGESTVDGWCKSPALRARSRHAVVANRLRAQRLRACLRIPPGVAGGLRGCGKDLDRPAGISRDRRIAPCGLTGLRSGVVQRKV